jgi:hypothetical protein
MKRNIVQGEREKFFEAMYNEAVALGRAAVDAAVAAHAIAPMGVSYKTAQGPRLDIIADGVCGFAWVNVKPGTSPFAKWLKDKGFAHKSYDGGVDIWVSDYNQSMQKKECFARAMAQHFSDNGHRATARSRMD